MYDKLSQLHASGRMLRHACGETDKLAIAGLAGKAGLAGLRAAGWAVQHPFKALTGAAGAQLAAGSIRKGVRVGKATRVHQAARRPTYAARRPTYAA